MPSEAPSLHPGDIPLNTLFPLVAPAFDVTSKEHVRLFF